jgi:Leucine-rich repeat (LRR) protein
MKEDFPKLEVLNLSYNQLTPASIRHLYLLPRLKNLDLQGNNLVTLPDDLKELKHLEDLNLSSNLLSSQSTLINPAILMKVLGQIPKLKRLNLSRNKL